MVFILLNLLHPLYLFEPHKKYILLSLKITTDKDTHNSCFSFCEEGIIGFRSISVFTKESLNYSIKIYLTYIFLLSNTIL